MSESYAADRTAGGLQRLGGFAGLAFIAGLVLQNAVFGRGGPLPDASIAEVMNHYAEAGAGSQIALALVAINMPLLFLFASTARERLESSSSAGVPARIAAMAVVLLSAAFGATAVLQAVLLAGGAGAETTQVLWDLHTASLLFSQLALGIALAGFSTAALVAEDLAPRWASQLGVAGAVLLITAAALPVAAVEGSKVFFLGFPGFFTWVVWLASASLRMVRAPRYPNRRTAA